MRRCPYRNRFLAAYAGLGLVLVAAATGTWLIVALPAKAARCVPLAAPNDPLVTAIAFIEGAVERKNPGGSYGLVIPPLKRGMTCEQWVKRMPVKPFHRVDWNRASYRLTAGGTGQLVYEVTLPSLVAVPGYFLLELRQDGDRWLVGFWDSIPKPAQVDPNAL